MANTNTMLCPSDWDCVPANHIVRAQVEERVSVIAASACAGTTTFHNMGTTGLIGYVLTNPKGSRRFALAKGRVVALLRKRGWCDQRIRLFKRALGSAYATYWHRACLQILSHSAC